MVISLGKNPRSGGMPAKDRSIIGRIIEDMDQVFILLFIWLRVLIFILFKNIKIGVITRV